MISLCYLMIYLLNNGQLPGVTDGETDPIKCFVEIRDVKRRYTLESLCAGKAHLMSDILEQVFTLKFKEKPDYEDIKNKFQ